MRLVQNFRENLRDHMSSRGLSQRQFAERSGVSTVTINRILVGKNSPSLEIVDRLADALGVPASRLLASPEKKSKTRAKSA